jgi:hypothetical protein
LGVGKGFGGGKAALAVTAVPIKAMATLAASIFFIIWLQVLGSFLL